jgi:CRP-like cAMP-binding protein
MGMIDAKAGNSLASLQLLEGLSPAALADVRAAARIRRVPRNTRLFNQGDGSVRAHALIEGYVRISQSGSDGAQVVMRFIRPGDLFGSVALFTDGRYPADADALTDLTEVSWSESDLAHLMDRHHRIATNFIGIIGKRLQEVQNRVRELATQRVERRIAHALLRLARNGGDKTADGITIAFQLRRKDIADICGTTLHSASRIITPWERAGWLITRDQRVTICNLAEIEHIAEAD